jgi:hypothetical protein
MPNGGSRMPLRCHKHPSFFNSSSIAPAFDVDARRYVVLVIERSAWLPREVEAFRQFRRAAESSAF